MSEWRALFSKLRRLLLSRGRSPEDIDDLMQEAFLRLQVYCRDNEVQHTEAFLVRTALNLSAEEWRKSRVRQTVAADVEALELADPKPTPDEILAGRQRMRRFQAGLDRLSPRTREAFLLHRMDGYSYLQIAEQLGISVSTVEKHIARASYFLRDWMERHTE